MRSRSVWFALACCLIAAAVVRAEEEPPDPLDLALTELGLTRRDLAPDPFRAVLRSSRTGALSWYQELLLDPVDSGYRAALAEERFLRWQKSPQHLAMYLGGLWDADIARGAIDNPLEGSDALIFKSPDPLRMALLGTIRTVDGTVSEDWDFRETGTDSMPPQWRREVARLLSAGMWAKQWHERAYRGLGDYDPQAVFNMVLLDQPVELPQDYRWLIEEMDREAVVAPLLDAAMVLEGFLDFANSLEEPPSPFEYRASTPVGLVRVSTMRTSDTLADGPYLLNVDWFGNDTYGGEFTAGTATNPLSLCIDWDGNDTYQGGAGRPGPGAGFFGTGVIYDHAGNDEYTGEALCSGAALFGASLLLDNAGNDRHEAVQNSQGSAVGGVALLLDRGGDDEYAALTSSQAFGGAMGVGMLMDLDGGDTYLLRPTPVRFPSPQNPKRNSSLGQGCGKGERFDLIDGKSLSGGIGFLVDHGGDDTYTASVMAQGVGFLGGAGLLMDDAGNDRYDGTWYVQGSSAHRAYGLLLDRAGDDRYRADVIISQGAAHDFSVSVLADLEGNDSYEADRISIGASNENSIALFIEASGDDSYTIRSGRDFAFGSGKVDMWGGIREDSLGVGLFFDLGGADSYRLPAERGVGNNRQWKNPQQYPDLNLRADLGFGLDGEVSELPFLFHTRTPPSPAEEQIYQDALRARRMYRRMAANK
ncbi:hypothetical protein HZA57_00685 [Candidatus Poribacteria bacterium]|nr:hypothetical protein [Candidatus Poribacteria bacterium]